MKLTKTFHQIEMISQLFWWSAKNSPLKPGRICTMWQHQGRKISWK